MPPRVDQMLNIQANLLTRKVQSNTEGNRLVRVMFLPRRSSITSRMAHSTYHKPQENSKMDVWSGIFQVKGLENQQINNKK